MASLQAINIIRSNEWKRHRPARARKGGLRVATSFALAFAVAISGALVSRTETTNAAVDTGTLSSITQITGAQDMWNRGYTGAGVGVAVIDTGVARVPGLDRPGKVIDGPDFSFDSQIPYLANTDAFGHGTHLAGIIAGSDVAPGTPGGCATCLGSSPYTDTTKFVGVAPESTIINVKVGAYDGATDVSQVIAGINWVVQHRNDPGLNIRVLNLSFGTDSVQSAAVDPLVFAVEQAWKAGIVVVVAGGNDGNTTGPLANPAISPLVIAVGATDPEEAIRVNDDEIPLFAQHGTPARGVDLAAPGVSVQSLRVPGSFVDMNATTGKDGERFQRASGTSQSAAVVSGLAALVISKFPSASPDLVKAMLKKYARTLTLSDKDNRREFQGSGSGYLTNIAQMTQETMQLMAAGLPAQPAGGTGTGSLEAARGSFHLESHGITLSGEVDIFGRPWVAASATDWPAVWPATDWSGYAWVDVTADNSAWDGARWSGARWSGARWSGARWSGARWSGARWSGARWSDAGWL